MANLIQVKRGLKSKLPVLAVSEFGFCTDTKEVFIGSGTVNIGIATTEHTHDFTHNHDDIYYKKLEVDTKVNLKSDKTYVDIELAKKANSTHTHTDKADKTYVDTELGKKVNTTTLTGHTDNVTIHVTQTDKNNWNGKANVSQIPTKLSQLQADIELGGNFSTIGTAKPTDGSMWYKVIG